MAIPTTPSGMKTPSTGIPARPPTEPDDRTPERYAPAPPGLGTFGMAVFLLALGVLFTASLVAYLSIRARAAAWPPPNEPPLPAGLWVSTVVILLCSASIHTALRSVRRDRQGTLLGALLVTLLLSLIFLVSQAANWYWLIAMQGGVRSSLYLYTFYCLTGLHALHVIGGLALLGVVFAKAAAGRYSAAFYPGVRYAAMYWHFLDAVWLVMFVLMFLT
jgi:cytochrome c oxidase subunit III